MEASTTILKSAGRTAAGILLDGDGVLVGEALGVDVVDVVATALDVVAADDVLVLGSVAAFCELPPHPASSSAAPQKPTRLGSAVCLFMCAISLSGPR